MLALKALNSRLIDGTKDTPRGNAVDSERRNEVVISMGDSEQSAQVSSNNITTSNKKT